jgi:exodeoxyribonuclease VII large subunit
VREDTFTVADLTRGLARAVTRAFPDEIWVEGEIRDLSRSNRGHVYFSLVDPSPEADPSAPAPVLPVTLFASDREVVNRSLMRAGAPRMIDGIRVRVRGGVSFYGPRARVQLRMTSVDTEYTVGAYAAERARVLRSLLGAGLLERNRSLALPLVPLRVGLVTSEGSAAEADFLTELSASGFAFNVTAVDTRVQGPAAPATLMRALALAIAAEVQIICVVRGGGSQSDLAAFDDEGVARAIATAPVPVFTGIGHEVDEAIADRVAAATFKTPTACAAAVVSRVAAFDERLDMLGRAISANARSRLVRGERRLGDMTGRVRSHARGRLQRGTVRLDRSRGRLGALAGMAMDRQEYRVAAVAGRLRRTAPRRIDESARLVAARAAVVAAHDPQQVLARGWSIVRNEAGRLVRSVSDLGPGDTMTATLIDGAVVGRVERVQPQPQLELRGDVTDD